MMPQVSFPVPLTSRWYYRGPQCRIVPLTEPGLWVPLSCAIAIANGGAAHVTLAGNGTSASINATGATLLAGVVSNFSTALTPTDNAVNSYTALASQQGTSSVTTAIVYAANPTVSASLTFTLSGSFCAGCFVAFSGVSTTSPFDGQQNGLTNATSPAQPGAVMPVNNDSLILTGEGGATTAVTSVSGFTSLDFVATVGGVNFSAADAYVVQAGAPSSANPTWTYTDPTASALVIGCFKPGGVSGVLLNLLH